MRALGVRAAALKLAIVGFAHKRRLRFEPILQCSLFVYSFDIILLAWMHERG